jgi:hypothetical protein
LGAWQSQAPPQPSLLGPQSTPLQLGVQVPHFFAVPPPPQVAGAVQPQGPPQPSLLGPQSTPLHVGMHIGGSTQLLFGPQTLPAGQQRSPHCCLGAAQVQARFAQLQTPGPQLLPQPPQLATSVEVSTQAFPHLSGVGATQSRVQAPLTQLWPEGQMLPAPPHFPQWA